MNDPHTRLHHLKIVIASVLLVTFGIVLLGIGQLANEAQPSGWASFIPWDELGGVIIGAGLLSVWLDYLFRREQQAMSDLRLRQILHDHAPAMRDAVLDAFAANHDDLVRVATPDTLDQIITNSMALRLEDEQFATEVWNDIRDQAVNAPERRYDASLDINLVPHPDAPDYFMVTVRREYTAVPAHGVRRFVCLSDRREYAELTQARDGTSAWFKKEDDTFSANDRATYQLLQLSVNGEERTIRRSSRKHYQAYTAEIGADTVSADQPVTISYTFRTVTRADGNLLFFDIEQPTRDISIALDYTGCNIKTMSAIDQVPSVRPRRIEHSPVGVPAKTVRVEIDGWVFPRAGVSFVWSLNKS